MAVVQAGYLKRGGAGLSANLPPPRAVVPTNGAGPSPAALSIGFRNVAKAVKPAVVYINIVEAVSGGSVPQIPGFGFAPRQNMKQQASGSGFIVTPDGFILTNNHVVGKADKIEVTLADGRKFRATRVGTDPDTDLAVIKIDATGLPTAVLGDSDAIEQGDWVLAIGSPFGFQQTLTAGIVSATGRTLVGPDSSNLDRYIQTDASINPGNSGGPLVDMQGEVVGINTLIYSPSSGGIFGGSNGGNIGIGFSIPSNLARRVYEQLVKTGKVSRGYLGIFVEDLDEAKARAFNVAPHAGVLVANVTDQNSPAAKAGLRTGDIVTAIDGKHVEEATELTDDVIAMPIGHSARVDYIREGVSHTVSVTLEERPTGPVALNAEPENGNDDSAESRSSKLGIVVWSVTPYLASQLKLKSTTGAYVVSAESGSPADLAGILPGDVIHRIGSVEINNAGDVVRASKDLKSGEEVAVQVERGGRVAFINVSID